MNRQDQNSELNIKRLSAQRSLHSKAKIKQHIQFSISLIGCIIILIPILMPSQNKETQLVLSALPFIFLFINLIFISPLIKKQRENAAKIQEEFDCDILSIDWNHLKIKEKARPDIVSKEYLNTQDIAKEKLKDWYNSDIIESKGIYKKLYAQRTNVNWDINVKEKYLRLLVFISIIVLIEAILIIIMKDYRPFDILFLVLMPLSAFINTVWIQIADVKAVIKGLESINSQIEKFIQNANEGKDVSEIEIRATQDQIFDLRKTSLYVPDIIFWKSREEQTNIDKEVTKQKRSEIYIKVENKP